MKGKKEFKYYFHIFVLVCGYWILTQLSADPPNLSTRITTTTALIAAVTFWMQLRRTENLNEASFIMNLNNQFISNKELTEIEHYLELYYNDTLNHKDINEIQLKINMDRNHPEYQKLVNYLVYMESLAALIDRNVLHLGVIDDLFAYRFFIAVNNPIVQKKELLPFANYYRGCFKLSQVWTKNWKRDKRHIPLGEYALCDCKKSLMNKPFVEEI